MLAMVLSVFDLFKIGIGPSSSHTVGPMKAAGMFVRALAHEGHVDQAVRVAVRLYGSLGATGKGHGTDTAVMLGLEGFMPDTIDPDTIAPRLEAIRHSKSLRLNMSRTLDFQPERDILFLGTKTLPFHPNGIEFMAFGQGGGLLAERRYFSVGGGFVVAEGAAIAPDGSLFSLSGSVAKSRVPFPFQSGDELLAVTEAAGMSIGEVMRSNELAWRSNEEIDTGLDAIWNAMKACVERGCRTEGYLPGSLMVKRRAPAMYRALVTESEQPLGQSLEVLDFLNVYAMAVNEENASGGRVVTAPTNGAAGIVPAVLHYYERFFPQADKNGIYNFLLTAAAVGLLYKANASISGAEVGCQGEVGVACSMAAAGLAAVMGGTPRQIENAAEIGMEHNLGLTCDPVGGRVQIPCIERNAIGAVKALNAARMAMRGNGKHFVSLDQVMMTMNETGRDMMTKYKETSHGGLAVHVVEC